MPASSPTQNLGLCITLMALSGAIRVVATMVLAYPDFRARQQGQSLSNRPYYIAGHVTLIVTAAMISVAGTLFGPVSIAIPVQTASMLLANVVAMSVVLRMRQFDKAQRTGTYVVFFSVLSLVDVGPATQDNQDVLQLIHRSQWWCVLVTCGILGSAAGTLWFQFRQRQSSTWNFAILAAGVTLSNVGMATSGKTLGDLRGAALGAAVAYYLVASGLGLLFSILSATACDQGIFTPLTSVALILVNMLTGIIVWEDGKVMHTWVAYLCSCALMCLGVYLLAEIDLLEKFWRYKTAELITHPDGCESEEGREVITDQVDAWQDCLMEGSASPSRTRYEIIPDREPSEQA